MRKEIVKDCADVLEPSWTKADGKLKAGAARTDVAEDGPLAKRRQKQLDLLAAATLFAQKEKQSQLKQDLRALESVQSELAQLFGMSGITGQSADAATAADNFGTFALWR